MSAPHPQRTTRAGRDVRVLRAAVFAAVCVVLAAGGHALGSCVSIPLWTLGAGFLVVLAVAVPLAGRERSMPGIAAPSHPDDEKTFDELHDRIRKTVEFLRSLNKEQFAEAADRAVTFKAGGKDLTVKGAQYLSNVGLPNFYFHVTTAYGLLRHNGVEIGKSDFLARALS